MIPSGATIKLPRPHEGQAQVLSGRKRRNVLACGRRWGKTKLGGSLAIEPASRGLPVGWFVPNYKLMTDAVQEISQRLAGAPGFAKWRSDDRRFDFINGGVIEFWTTEPRQAGEDESEVARGRKYARIIYDEAARARRLKADWTKSIRATLTDYRGDAWFLSTPKGRNYFWQLYMRGVNGEDGWASFQMPTSTNPHIAPEEIEEARKELPADAYEQEYLALFLANAANPFGVDAIRACIADITPGPIACWGVDLAKSHDWTVAIGLDEGGNVVAFQRWQSDWRNTRARLSAMLRNAPSLVDSTGVGDPIVEDLQAANGSMVEGYQFTRPSKQRLMEGLAVSIQNREVSYPDGPIVYELESFEYEYTPTGTRYSAPSGMHDDCVCALALAVQCWRQRVRSGGVRVRVLEKREPVAAGVDDNAGWYGWNEDE